MRANKLWLTFVLGAVALASVHGCKKQEALEGTALLVKVTLDGVSADQLRYTGFDTADDGGVFGPAARPDAGAGQVPSPSTERVLLQDSLAQHTLDVWVEALHQGSPVGAGHNTVTVRLGVETPVDVTIAPMAADAGCTGCYANGTCIQTISSHACGLPNGVCSDCGIHGDSCVNGDCKCGSGPACLASGAELCDSTTGTCKSSCAGCIVASSGTCDGNPNTAACGVAGSVCVDCNPNGAMTSNSCGTDGQCHCGVGPPCTPIVGGNYCNNGVCQCGSQPACGGGMECLNNTCVCTSSSCPNGCCIGNTCVPGDGTSACGHTGGACLDCGGTECDGGVCAMALCNAGNCPNGCCSGATCYGSNSDAGCGIGGAACTRCGTNEVCLGGACVSTCNLSNCDAGCCDRNGVCQAGTDPAMCGTGAAACANCGSNACTQGMCTGGGCGPGTCSGCCDGGTCVTTPSPSSCGLGGNACVNCGADPCANGACVTCSPATCDGGCCSAGKCTSGTVQNACGTGGATCASCGSGTCTNQACVAACTAANCDGGCCDSSGVCQPDSLAACGASGSGSACMACNARVANNCGPNGCRCGNQAPCAFGNVCGADGGCSCDPTTCQGCCGGGNGLCQTGTAKNACGVMGVACVNCMGNLKCDGGACQ